VISRSFLVKTAGPSLDRRHLVVARARSTSTFAAGSPEAMEFGAERELALIVILDNKGLICI
jgi:hypothetical protein